MKKEEADKIAKQIFRDLNIEQDKIMEKAKKEGRWLSGLDSNRDLFIESDNRAKAKLKELASQIEK